MTSKEEQFIKDHLSVPKGGPRDIISGEMASALLACSSGLSKKVLKALKVRCYNGNLMTLNDWAVAAIEEDCSGLMYGEWE